MRPCRRWTRGLALTVLLQAALATAATGNLALRRAQNTRIEALTLLDGDFALASGSLRTTSSSLLPTPTESEISMTNFGGAGDVGDPVPLRSLPIGWQPHLQGTMGYLEATDRPAGGLDPGLEHRYHELAIGFGAGARFWFTDRFSLAPVLATIYGHLWDGAQPSKAASNPIPGVLTVPSGTFDTWTLRPSLNAQYLIDWKRMRLTLSADFAQFQSWGTQSNRGLSLRGDARTAAATVDIDIPLGRFVLGHELRTGGYVSRTELFGDLRDGLGVAHLDEVHGRIVIDVLDDLWKLQWLGVGASYFHGTQLSGWAAGADVALRF